MHDESFPYISESGRSILCHSDITINHKRRSFKVELSAQLGGSYTRLAIAIVAAALVIGASISASSLSRTVTITVTTPSGPTGTATSTTSTTSTTTTPTVCYSYVTSLPVVVNASSTNSAGAVTELGSFAYGGNPCVVPNFDAQSNTRVEITITALTNLAYSGGISSTWITCSSVGCPQFTIDHATNVTSTSTYVVSGSSTVTKNVVATEWQVQMTFTGSGSYLFEVLWQSQSGAVGQQPFTVDVQ